MINAANDNRRPASAGSSYCPELGETHDGKALFVARVGYNGYSVRWAPARHAEALAAFKALKIRPRSMDVVEMVKGASQNSACVTWAAGEKVLASKYAVLLAHLD